MTVKRGATEGVYGAAPQRLGDTAKKLDCLNPNVQWRKPHARR
jgi:hypothetical protein